MSAHITKDEAYNTVAPDDFASMLQVERYGVRTTAFDKIITATHDHFWDPLDPAYIDFSTPFDMANKPIMPAHMRWFVLLQTNLAKVLESLQIYKDQKSGWVDLHLAP